MNLLKLPAAYRAGKDLLSKVIALRDNPKFKALMESDPEVKAASDKISQDARTITEALR